MAALHGAQGFGDEGGELVCGGATVGEGLVEGEFGELEAGERGGVNVAGINPDGAVEHVDAVVTEATA